MSRVIDASVAAAWLLPDESHPMADAALDLSATESAIVPSLWWFEIRNILIQSERRRRIAPHYSQAALQQLSRLRFIVDESIDEVVMLNLARRHGLTVYDASYLEIAQRRALPLATLDRELMRAAAAEKVSLFAS